MFHEYPKALYLGGVASSLEETEHVTVHSAEEEAEQNAQGWYVVGTAPDDAAPADAEAPKRRGRPRKDAQQ